MSDDEEVWDDDFRIPEQKKSASEFVDDQASEEKDHMASPGTSDAGDPLKEDDEEDINDFLKDSSSSEDDDDEDAEEDHNMEEQDDDEDPDEDGVSEPDALKRLMQSSKEQPKKKHKHRKSEFIEDEAELSGDDVVSDDELEQSDDDQYDPEIVDQDAKDLSSGEEEEVRRLYHKQLETEDKRAVLILQEQLEENEVGIGQRRRRKFKWQTRDLMENSLKRHYDPDDEDSADEDDVIEYNEVRLRRPTAESLLLGSTKLRRTTVPHAEYDDEDMFSDDEENDDTPIVLTRGRNNKSSGSGLASNEDSSSMFMHALPSTSAGGGANGDLNKYVYRDKELVQALSTKEVLVNTREEKDRIIQRELKKVVQSKSIFDQLY